MITENNLISPVSSTRLILVPTRTSTALPSKTAAKNGQISLILTGMWLVRKMALKTLTDHYQKWCSRRKYNFSKSKSRRNLWKSQGIHSRIFKGQLYQIHHQTGNRPIERCLTDRWTASHPNEWNCCRLPEYPVDGDKRRRTVSRASAYGQDRRCHTLYPQRYSHSICRCRSWFQRFWGLSPEKCTCF